MANSSLLDLPTLNTNSVMNVSSLFFYMSDNDANRLVSGKVIQSLLGWPETTLCVRTSNFAVTTNNSVALTWEQTLHDPWGMWSSASASLIVPGFNGMVQFVWRTETDGTGLNPAKQGIRKNGSLFIGNGFQNDGDSYTGHRNTMVTAPVSCAPGDYFEAGVQYPGTGNVIGTGGTTWLECQPLQVYT